MIYDLIIIGGGPAGITAGIYAARQDLKALLITKEFGGQMAKKTVDVENYTGFPKISGIDLIKKFEEHLKGVKIEIEKNEVVNVEKEKGVFTVLTKDKKELQAKTVIVASGAKQKMLNVLGEKEYLGKGISYCPMCDGPMFKGKQVAVVGCGDAGFETAIWLARYVKKIFILEYLDKISASKTNQKTAKKTNKIEIITGADIKEIKGDNFVRSLVYTDLKTKKTKEIEVSGVFVEIGYQPAASFVEGLVDLSEKKEIKISLETGETKTKGLFAAGDVNRGKCKQIIVACGEGAVAATSAQKYLENISLA